MRERPLGASGSSTIKTSSLLREATFEICKGGLVLPPSHEKLGWIFPAFLESKNL